MVTKRGAVISKRGTTREGSRMYIIRFKNEHHQIEEIRLWEEVDTDVSFRAKDSIHIEIGEDSITVTNHTVKGKVTGKKQDAHY